MFGTAVCNSCRSEICILTMDNAARRTYFCTGAPLSRAPQITRCLKSERRNRGFRNGLNARDGFSTRFETLDVEHKRLTQCSDYCDLIGLFFYLLADDRIAGGVAARSYVPRATLEAGGHYSCGGSSHCARVHVEDRSCCKIFTFARYS